ncbi:MAG: DegQ family serine endoprotease [Xanthomonadales bacterium]|nr:DegQ family serine endoprotease [Xanthomonadales bacterium]
MSKRFLFILLAVALTAFSTTGLARVSGLPDFTGLVEEAGPAVVNIRVTQFGDSLNGDQRSAQVPEDMPEFFRRFFDRPDMPDRGQQPRQGAGSGFIIESDGYIITNHHVVDGADEILVRMADRHEYKAELIGSDALSDIALLKIDADDLPTLKLGDSESLKPGEWVVAIGSPFNFDQSVTAGIVSAKGRSNAAQQYVPFIQTDVAINRGNSGGPLLNLDGEVVGINSWILSSNGGYIGLSFSIPIETANITVKQLREHGKVSRGLLGVQIQQVTREMAEALNLEKPVGALVDSVNPGSAAEKGGIESGDVILEFDGQEIETSGDLPPIVGANPPGTEAKVVVSRNGKRKTFEVVLDALEADEDGNITASTQGGAGNKVLGLTVEPISDDRRRALGDPEGGVIVSAVDNDAAYRAGLRRGDVILTINNMKVEDVESFETIAENLEAGKAVALRVMRDGVTRYIAYTPSEEEE